jgi:hypothetical protein
MDSFFALLVFVMFVSAVFAGGFYVGYRYRNKLSLERHKTRRHFEQREVFQAPKPAPVTPTQMEITE